MFSISRAIIHEIPKGRFSPNEEARVAYSDSETPLAAETKRFIEENMLGSSLDSARSIVEDVESGSNTPQLVKDMLVSADSFVDGSKEIADNLFRAQTSNSPSGVLFVAVVNNGHNDSVLLLKAEHAEGMRLQRVGDDSSGHFDLEHLKELIVGNNSRIYKIAVLGVRDDSASGEMVDRQNGAAFADFFMSSFLGCRLADDSEVATKHFVDSSLTWINKHVDDQADRTKYANAFMAYIHSPEKTFKPADFADQFLEAEDRDDYIDHLPDRIPRTVTNKNLNLVPGQGAGMKIYGHGFVVSASVDAIERGDLTVLSEDDGSTVIRVKGSLRRFGLGNSPKG